jgi:hypothetical protein
MSPSMSTATTTLSPFSLVQANVGLNEQLWFDMEKKMERDGI